MLVNRTPHSVVVLRDDPEGEIEGSTGVGPAAEKGRFSVIAEIAPSGLVARAAQIDEAAGELVVRGYAVPLITTTYGSPYGLPDEPEEGVYFIVSILTAQAAKAVGRTTSDLLVTSDPVRDAAGKIIGCRKFAVI